MPSFPGQKVAKVHLMNCSQELFLPQILKYPNDQDKFILDTDASDKAMGPVLSQVQEEVERVVAYGSKTFLRSEKNYCVTRKELLAVVYFVKHFNPIDTVWGLL